MNLDAGSGFAQTHKHITEAIHLDVQRTKTVNVIGDVQHLPFCDKAFDHSFCLHVLEHVKDPILAIRELIRVTKQIIEIEVPYRFSWNAKQKRDNPFDNHIWSFDYNWFSKVLRNYSYHEEKLYYWPRTFYIHVYIYPSLSRQV